MKRKHALLGALLAAAVTATLALTATGSQAVAWECRGGSYQMVCADLRLSSTGGSVRGAGRAMNLSTNYTYRLRVTLYKSSSNGYWWVLAGPTDRVQGGVPAFEAYTDYGLRRGDSCYQSRANLYRMRPDRTWDWLVGVKKTWC